MLRSRHGEKPLREGSAIEGYYVRRVIREELGETVYEAEDRDGRPCAVVASAAADGGHADRARFRRLARLRVRISHPALLPVYDWGQRGRTRFLVTAAYPPRPLADTIRSGALAPTGALSMLMPVAEALDVCHAQGLVHQRFGAESVLLDEDGPLLDGFALTTVEAERDWSRLSPRMFRYGSPERMRGEAPEPATDVYALTAVLVHALTGSPPYAGTPLPANAAWAAAMMHATEPPPRPSERMPELGSEIDAVVAWGMAKEPAERPRSAVELVEAAADALSPASRFRRTPSEAARRNGSSAGGHRGQAAGRETRGRRFPRLAPALVVVAAAAAGLAAAALAEPFGDGSPRETSGPTDAAVVRSLDERRGPLRSALAEASQPNEQAAAASALAAAYRGAAARMESPALSSASRTAASAYDDLAESAEAGSAPAYAVASSAVDAAEQRMEAAVEAAGRGQDPPAG
jgi:serine/threonine-protein kinase